MKRILLIGAGRSTKVLIQYLLDYSIKEDWKITVGDYCEDSAKQSVGNHKNANGIFFKTALFITVIGISPSPAIIPSVLVIGDFTTRIFPT